MKMYHRSPKMLGKKANQVGKMIKKSKKRREGLLSGEINPTSYLDLAVLNPEIVEEISKKLQRQREW